jgi:hypothetical protein
MKPLNCCKNCDGLNENGTFRNKLRCIMSCDNYVVEETMKLYNEQKDDKGCSTCKHCEHIHDYPAYVTAEESICRAGLECDTVYFTVKNCPKWVGKFGSEG